MSNTFVPELWAESIMESMKRNIDRDILEMLEGNLWKQAWDMLNMKIDPNLESFFVAIALLHRTHPQPLFGIDRTNLAREITAFMSQHPGQPEVLQKVRKNYRELGGRLLDTDPEWFYTKLADAYLDWLYSQPESMELLPAALEKIKTDQLVNREVDSMFKRGPQSRANWKTLFGK